MDHFSDFTYVNIMIELNSKSMVEAKQAENKGDSTIIPTGYVNLRESFTLIPNASISEEKSNIPISAQFD